MLKEESDHATTTPPPPDGDVYAAETTVARAPDDILAELKSSVRDVEPRLDRENVSRTTETTPSRGVHPSVLALLALFFCVLMFFLGRAL